jgi:flagellar hook protein FlgE
MSLAAMNNSSLALLAQSQSLATISQNISNVSTTGYKTSETMFSTVLSEATATADIFSVQADNRTMVDRQGDVTSTGNWSDLAINGDGMFMVNTAKDGSGSTYFTRDGSFDIAAVDSNGDGTEDTAYLVDSNGYYLQGWAANSDGSVSSDSGSLSAVHYAATSIPGVSTTTASISGTVDATATTDQSLGMSVFGPELGSDGTASVVSQALTMTWSPSTTTTNGWNVNFSIPGATISNASANATFDGAGKMTSDGKTALNVTWGDGSTTTINVDYSNVAMSAGTTTVRASSQDGYAPGDLASVGFDSDGRMTATYDNGKTLTDYQVALADFVAPNSLQELSGNLFAQTQDAGKYTLVAADKSSTSFVAGAVEASTVDLNDQFTKMVMTQTAYTSASKVFSVADQMVTTVYQLGG